MQERVTSGSRLPDMVIRSLSRYAVAYVVTELAAAALLIWAFGLGWTFVVLAATFMAGVVLAGSQMKSQVASLRRAHANPRSAAAEGALVGLGTALVFLPGIVTTAAGVLMLAPPTRSAMRPWLRACSPGASPGVSVRCTRSPRRGAPTTLTAKSSAKQPRML